MLKYVTIPDIRRYPSYRSINARILYMHLAMSMDIGTRTYAHSWRQLSADLDMPLQQLRTALKQLEKDGLIVTQQVTQTVTYGVTQRVTHKVTQIYIVSVSDLDEATNEATNSPTNSPTNSDKNNITIPNRSITTHTTARVDWAKKAEEVGRVLKIDAPTATSMVDDFRQRQEWKGKSWESEGDLLAHLVSWCEKRLPLHAAKRKTVKQSDHEARMAEYERTRQETERRQSKNRTEERLEYLKTWSEEYARQGDKEKASQFDMQYRKELAMYHREYQPQEAS